MPKFAVYYIPQHDDPFYRLGTQILGYDVRTRSSVMLPSDIREALGQWDEAWTTVSRPYGFHLTISDAIDCHWATIPLGERELADVLGCFDPAHPFTLQQRASHNGIGLIQPGLIVFGLHARSGHWTAGWGLKPCGC